MTTGDTAATVPDEAIELHLRHSIDGYPLCWPMDREGEFTATTDAPSVTCTDCRAFMEGKP